MVLMGDIGQAEAYIRRNASLVQEARGSPHPNWRNAYTIYGRSWEADADEGRALIFEARGQFKEAAQAAAARCGGSSLAAQSASKKTLYAIRII
jgi:hypothetical protein